MNYTIRRFVTSLCLAASLVTFSNADAQDDLVTLYIPAFSGPPELGLNVATVLNLQIWRTLRKAHQGKTFGRGLIIWDTDHLAGRSFEVADEMARRGLDLSNQRRVYPQLVFWGQTQVFGAGVVVEAFLSIPPISGDGRIRDRWEVTIQKEPIDLIIDADLPERRYEFSPIVLKKELVKSYTKPTALPIYASREATTPIGNVGAKFEAREQHDEWVRLESDGKDGWVPLPNLAKERNELVDFVGGVIRIFRSDWNGAITLFEKVVKNARAPTALKIDALLYQVMAKSKAGQDPTASLKKALDLSPLRRTTIVYSVMAKLEVLSREIVSPSGAKTVANLIQKIETELQDNRQLFSPGDTWLAAVTQLLETLKAA
jgi:hypothetical protein